MEFNKIAAAVLVAGIIALGSSILAEHVVHAETHLEEDSYPIVVADAAATTKAPEVKEEGPEPVDALMASADPAAGAALFKKKCSVCHNADKGGPNKVGPNLWGVFGAKKGTHPGFSYSKGMEAKGGTWTVDDLNHFTYKPRAFVSGTKMNFAGLKKASDRANIIAFFKSLK